MAKYIFHDASAVLIIIASHLKNEILLLVTLCSYGLKVLDGQVHMLSLLQVRNFGNLKQIPSDVIKWRSSSADKWPTSLNFILIFLVEDENAGHNVIQAISLVMTPSRTPMEAKRLLRVCQEKQVEVQ